MKVEIYVPSVSPTLENVPHEALVKGTAETMSILCGGATAIPAKGYYTHKNGDLAIEDVTIVHTFAEPDMVEKLRTFAQMICLTAEQECVLFVVDGVPEFVTGDELKEAKVDQLKETVG